MTDATEVIASIEAAIERATDTLHNARLWESEGTYDDYIAPALSQARDHIDTLTRERDEALKSLDENWVTHQQIIALRKERDEARRDAERLADVIRAALNAPIDIGELAGHCEGDAFFFDGYELARTRIDAALTADAEATP